MLNRLFMSFAFRNVLIRRAYRVQDFERMAAEAGWTDPKIESSDTGYEALMRK